MLKRRPPLTTLATRRTCTTVSSRFNFEASILGILSPRGLEIQAYFTGAFCKCSHAPMIGVAATIKDDPADTFLLGTLRNQLTHFTSYRYSPIVGDSGQRFNRCLFYAFLRARKFSPDLNNRFAPFAGCSLLWLTALCCCLLCPCSLSFGWGYFSRYLHGGFLRSGLLQFKSGSSFTLRHKVAQFLVQRRGCGQCTTSRIIDYLRIDMQATTVNAHAWPIM